MRTGAVVLTANGLCAILVSAPQWPEADVGGWTLPPPAARHSGEVERCACLIPPRRRWRFWRAWPPCRMGLAFARWQAPIALFDPGRCPRGAEITFRACKGSAGALARIFRPAATD